MSLLFSLGFALIYLLTWTHLNEAGHEILVPIAILLAGGLAGLRDT